MLGRGGLKYERVKIYIQAGHEGRMKGSLAHRVSLVMKLIVPDEATRILREAGVYVMRTTENIV